MERGLFDFYCGMFKKITNCSIGNDTGSMPLGMTRMGEIDDFVDAFMLDWTRQAELAGYAEGRFCTYAEYLSVFQPPRDGWDAPVFRMLGIDDVQKQKDFKKNQPPDRDGYFRLMEVLHPQVASFFFHGIQGGHTDQ